MKKYFIITGIILAIDQLTKYLVRTFMEFGESFKILGDYLLFTSHRNTGAAWGILSGHMEIFYLISVVVIIALLYILIKSEESDFTKTATAIFLAGTIGNFIDRIFFKEVTDFIDTTIPIINYDFPIFNIADMALVISVILIIYEMFFMRDSHEKI